MGRFLSPLCLLLALAMLFAGFALWSVDPPEAGMKLHEARVMGDDDLATAQESKLERRQGARKLLLFCLFGGSAGMTLAAFATLGSSKTS